jgi:IS30 family transposase
MKKRIKRRRSFRHLNQFDRDRIEALLKAGHKQEEVAKILCVDAGTISREIQKRKRKNGSYEALTAQHKANVKRSLSKYQGMKIEKYPELRLRIISELEQHRSPDEIAGRMKKEKLEVRVNANAMYKWLYSVWGQRYCRYLCTKRYRKKKQKRTTKREMIPNRISLEKRPKRGEHAEGDLFVSPIKTGVQRSGAIVCVPSAQLLVGRMIENKKPATMAQAIRQIDSEIAIDDLTMDNGLENKNHEQFGIPTYFADPHSPWQKPHVENGIGLLRRWFIKKGTDLETISDQQLQEYLHILNGKYRKSLGYQSAYEVAIKRGIIQQQKIPEGDLGSVIREKVAFEGRI